MQGGSALLYAFALVSLVCASATGQQANLHCNSFTPLIPPTITGTLSETHSTGGIGVAYWESSTGCIAGLPLGCGSTNTPDKVINASTTDFARVHLALGVDLSATMRVKDATNVYPGGNFAGFVIKSTSPISVDLLNSITIRTYKTGSATPVETSTTGSLLALNTLLVPDAIQVGFHTTSNFDAIEIEFNGLASLAVVHDVFYAVTRKFCNGATLVCNTPTSLMMSDGVNTGYPVKIDEANTEITGVCAGCSISEASSLIDSDPLTSAKIIMPVSAGTGSIAVKSVGQTYPAGTFAGFDLNNPALIGASLLSGIKIQTFFNGNPTVDVFGNGSLLGVNVPLISGSGRQVLGFLATTEFDEIKLTINQAGVNLGTTEVFGAVFTKFCSDTPLACNTLTSVKNPTHSVYVDGKNSLITSPVACAACAINNSQNVVDSDPANFATMVLTAGVLNSGTFTVANAITSYGPNSYAGFDIETSSLLAATVLGGAKIDLLLDGSVVQPWTGGSLILGVNSALLNGPNRQIIGVVAKAGITYNGVRITFEQPVGANLGTIKIFGAIFDNNCAGTIECNTSYSLNMPSDPLVNTNFPVVIDAPRTGSTGIACVLCSVKDAYNAVSPSLTDFAQMSTLVASAQTSLAVVNPIDTYPAGATAGFTVRKRGELVSLGLLDFLTITTYNDGVQQESQSAGGLLDLSITLFGGTSDFFNVGFVTKKPFDEVQISLGSLVSANLIDKSIDVYGAFVDTRTAAGGALLCFNTNPDNNVTKKGVQVSGNLSTNDNVAAGTQYKTPTADGSQPNPNNTDFPVIATDGTYTFVSNTPGIYSFNVQVCVPGQAVCNTEALTITVLDKDIANNPPVANDDVAIVKGNATTPIPVVVNVTANDGPGNPGGTLGVPTIPDAPANGTAIVENGKIKYTPNLGFYGEDVVTYQVCESPSGVCTKAELVVTVLRPEGANTLSASDDYASVGMNTTLTVNAANGVLANDSDPDGNTLTVTAQSNVLIAGVGTLNLATDGSYTFVPVSGYTGPASFVYAVSDGITTKNATLYILVTDRVAETDPDNNVTYKGVQVSGDVSTNDTAPAGNVYGTPVADVGNPAAVLPVLDSDGSYTFITSVPGIYSFVIPVCLTGQVSGCVTEKLTITVLDPTISDNPPVANDDVAVVKGNPTTPVPVTVDVTANDGPGNLGGTLGVPTIPSQPANGDATIVGGNVQYTPDAGFYGKDIVTYQVCESPSGKCTTAELVVTVLKPGAPNTLTASDDYMSTPKNATLTVSAAEGVLANDTDPDGDALSVTPAELDITGGHLLLNADGSYTFTPTANYSGPTSYVYTVCDALSNCKQATLYLLVQAVPNLDPTIPIDNLNFGSSGVSMERDFLVKLKENLGSPTDETAVSFRVSRLSAFDITVPGITLSGTDQSGISGNSTVNGTTANTNGNWMFKQDDNFIIVTSKPGVSFAGNGFVNIGFHVKRKASIAVNTTQNITVTIVAGSGGEIDFTDNTSIITIKAN